MRKHEQRTLVATIFEQIFGLQMLSAQLHNMCVTVDDVGRRCFRLGRIMHVLADDAPLPGRVLARASLGVFEHLALAIDMNWVIILVSRASINCSHSFVQHADVSGVGRTTLVDQLAALYSPSTIDYMYLNADTDALELIGGYEQIQDNSNGDNIVHFRWFDSAFVRAFTHGGWVVLDNAQCASAAVLDRLNGALEPDGQLVIGERALTIQRHADFR
jgi:midasin